jgi:hypothetical protein
MYTYHRPPTYESIDAFYREQSLFPNQPRPTLFGAAIPGPRQEYNPYIAEARQNAQQYQQYQPQYQPYQQTDQDWGKQMDSLFSQNQQSRTNSLFNSSYGIRPSKKNKRRSKKNNRRSKY